MSELPLVEALGDLGGAALAETVFLPVAFLRVGMYLFSNALKMNKQLTLVESIRAFFHTASKPTS